MKQWFSFVMVAAVIATALAVNVGTASAASSRIVLHLPGITPQELKNAHMSSGHTNIPVECVLKDAETGKVVCRVPGKYADLNGVLYVAGNVIMVHVPQPKTPDAPATGCGEGELLWYSWNSYYLGEFFQNGEMTVEEWEGLESSGYFDDSAEDGQTWTITGTFCAPLPED
ncbi:MAG TPA: hypothetical protein PKE62_13340 [Anaerolineales bacterium]|nr:hypothetical protein [Anaerolineales bacterium]